MKLQLFRFKHGENETLGLLYIDFVFECFTLEDQHQDVKVYGETRIPEGTYKIELRDEGGMTKRYAEKYPDIHKGMLWLQDVPGFEWVYLHVGNSHTESLGCPLLGTGVTSDQTMVTNSVAAYKALYPKVAEAIVRGEDVEISIYNV